MIQVFKGLYFGLPMYVYISRELISNIHNFETIIFSSACKIRGSVPVEYKNALEVKKYYNWLATDYSWSFFRKRIMHKHWRLVPTLEGYLIINWATYHTWKSNLLLCHCTVIVIVLELAHQNFCCSWSGSGPLAPLCFIYKQTHHCQGSSRCLLI